MEARRLIESAAADGAAALPALSAAELRVLCGDHQALAEQVEQLWWATLEEPARRELTGAVLDFLVFRGLLRAPQDDETSNGPSEGRAVAYPVVPALAIVVAARQRPTVLAVGTGPDGSTMGTPRMYGLGDQERPLRAVVAEQVTAEVREPFGPLHRFVLLSPERAASALASWSAASPEADADGRSREVAVYRHREGEELTRDVVTVAASPGGLAVTRRRPGAEAGAPVQCDQPELARLIAGILSGEDRSTSNE